MTGGIGIFRVDGLNAKAAAGAIAPIPSMQTAAASLGLRFIPQFAYLHIRTLVGAITTGPTIRIGTNATHDNICPLFQVAASSIAGQILTIPLVVPIQAPAISVSDILIELQASVVGPTSMTGDILLSGLIVG